MIKIEKHERLIDGQVQYTKFVINFDGYEVELTQKQVRELLEKLTEKLK